MSIESISPLGVGFPRTTTSVNKRGLLLRFLRAAQPISRSEMAERLKIDRSTVTEYIKPLIDKNIVLEDKLETKGSGRRSRVLSYNDRNIFFIGVNLGVRRSQVGLTTLKGDIFDEDDFETPEDPTLALALAKEKIEAIIDKYPDRKAALIGVSVPGITDKARRELVYAPNLNWKNIKVADALTFGDVPVVVENDSTAAATYEARVRIRSASAGLLSNFILVRSGTGIGVGLVIGSEVFRGSGNSIGSAGEFGHMTIVAGGKACVCGNRGCWEKYGSAAAAASLYIGNRSLKPGETAPRFIEIVSKAQNGDNRSRRTLEMIGDYLGIGIANVIMGIGIPHVIVSGRLVYGWEFIKEPMDEAIRRSIVGKTKGWSVEAGSTAGSAIGGALEVAVEEFLATV